MPTSTISITRLAVFTVVLAFSLFLVQNRSGQIQRRAGDTIAAWFGNNHLLNYFKTKYCQYQVNVVTIFVIVASACFERLQLSEQRQL